MAEGYDGPPRRRFPAGPWQWQWRRRRRRRRLTGCLLWLLTLLLVLLVLSFLFGGFRTGAKLGDGAPPAQANAASIRAFLAAGFVPVGAEALLTTNPE
jgi:hypothetical protein